MMHEWRMLGECQGRGECAGPGRIECRQADGRMGAGPPGATARSGKMTDGRFGGLEIFPKVKRLQLYENSVCKQYAKS